MNRFIRRIGDASAGSPWTTIGAWATLTGLVVALWWLPGWLDRLLPHVSLDSEALAHPDDPGQHPVRVPELASSRTIR